MLILTRNLTPGEVRTCKLSGTPIIYGDFYYQDTENPDLYIKKTEYDKLEEEKKRNEFDYSMLENLESQEEYAQYMKEAERQYLQNNILNHKIIKNGIIENTKF